MMPKPAMRYNRQVRDALPSSTTHRGSPDVAGWSAYPSIAAISISLPDRREWDGPAALPPPTALRVRGGLVRRRSTAMPRRSTVRAVTTIGIDMGKNTLHMVGLDSLGAIV